RGAAKPNQPLTGICSPAIAIERPSHRRDTRRENDMDVVFQNESRDRREQERQRQFRDRFIAETPPWYHGAMHLAFTLLVTGAAMWFCWNRIHDAGWL